MVDHSWYRLERDIDELFRVCFFFFWFCVLAFYDFLVFAPSSTSSSLSRCPAVPHSYPRVACCYRPVRLRHNGCFLR